MNTHHHPQRHNHDHDHGHGHAQGSAKHDHHNHAAHASHQRLAWALAITIAAMIVGVVGGYLSNSLALIADAGHMLADAAALALSLLAARQALRPPDATHSFGHARMPVLAAFINGLVLLGASAWIAFEAVERLLEPAPVDGRTMVIVAIIGLIANVVSFALLHGGEKEDLNRRGAAAHVLSDLLGSVAALIAGIVILQTNWLPADPILSMVAAGLVLNIGLRVVRESAHILLEGTPRGMDLKQLATNLTAQVPGVKSVHHVHAWSLSQNHKLVTLHAVPDGSASATEIIAGLHQTLKSLGITHVTVQVEQGACVEPDCADPSASDDDLSFEPLADKPHAHGHLHGPNCTH